MRHNSSAGGVLFAFFTTIAQQTTSSQPISAGQPHHAIWPCLFARASGQATTSMAAPRASRPVMSQPSGPMLTEPLLEILIPAPILAVRTVL
jgi:hypothetical protein